MIAPLIFDTALSCQDRLHLRHKIKGMRIDFKKSSVFTSHIISGSSPGNLWNLLSDNNFQIDLRYLPKLLLALPIILLNIPFIGLEKLLFSKKIRNTAVKQPIFIIGYPRSGTTYLMYLMSKDQQFAFCRMFECMGPHVIFTFGKVLRGIAKMVLPKKRPMDNLELGADLPKEEEFALGNMSVASMANALYFPKRFSTYFDRFVLFNGNDQDKSSFKVNMNWLFKKLTLKNNGKRLLLKSPFNTGRIKLLLEMYPDAKFIHIHRHPHKVFASNEKLYESVIPQVAFHTVSDAEMERHIFYTYHQTMERYFHDSSLLQNNQLFEMSYDDFISNPISIFKKMYSQLEIENFASALPLIEKEVAGYKNYKANIHNDDEGKRDRVYKELSGIYEKLGYSK